MTEIEIRERVINGQRRLRLEYYEREIKSRTALLVLIWKELRDDPMQPYLATHDSLESYLVDRWHMTTRRLQQVAAGEVIRAELAAEATPEIAPVVQRMNEGVLREIKALPPAQRMPVIAEAVRLPGKVTASKIKLAKARVIDPAPVPAPAPTLGRWTHANDLISCGGIPIARTDIDSPMRGDAIGVMLDLLNRPLP